MDFDFGKVIPLIIFVIWALFAGSKRKKPAKKQADTPSEKQKKPRSPLLGKLQSSLQNFFEQIEEAQAKASSQQKQRQSEYQSAEPVDDKEYDDVKTTESHSSDRTRKMVTKKPVRVPDSSQQKKHSSKRIKQLKKAVIWSEILAKPVGLREE